MNYRIEEITREDLNRIVDKYIFYYNNRGASWTYDKARKNLEESFLTPNFYGLGVFNRDEILGYAMGWFKEFDSIKLYYLEEVLIFKEYQNKGLGSKLLRELENLVVEKGASKINLITSYEEKHQRFYSRLGYERSNYIVAMSKII